MRTGMIRAPFEVASCWAGYKGQWILLSRRGSRRFIENWNLKIAHQLRWLKVTHGR